MPGATIGNLAECILADILINHWWVWVTHSAAHRPLMKIFRTNLKQWTRGHMLIIIVDISTSWKLCCGTHRSGSIIERSCRLPKGFSLWLISLWPGSIGEYIHRFIILLIVRVFIKAYVFYCNSTYRTTDILLCLRFPHVSFNAACLFIKF